MDLLTDLQQQLSRTLDNVDRLLYAYAGLDQELRRVLGSLNALQGTRMKNQKQNKKKPASSPARLQLVKS